MQVEISEEACTLSGIIEMNEDFVPPVEAGCKENKAFKLTNSDNGPPLRSVVCPSLHFSVSVAPFIAFCLRTVIRAQSDDRWSQERTLNLMVRSSTQLGH